MKLTIVLFVTVLISVSAEDKIEPEQKTQPEDKSAPTVARTRKCSKRPAASLNPGFGAGQFVGGQVQYPGTGAFYGNGMTGLPASGLNPYQMAGNRPNGYGLAGSGPNGYQLAGNGPNGYGLAGSGPNGYGLAGSGPNGYGFPGRYSYPGAGGIGFAGPQQQYPGSGYFGAGVSGANSYGQGLGQQFQSPQFMLPGPQGYSQQQPLSQQEGLRPNPNSHYQFSGQFPQAQLAEQFPRPHVSGSMSPYEQLGQNQLLSPFLQSQFSAGGKPLANSQQQSSSMLSFLGQQRPSPQASIHNPQEQLSHMNELSGSNPSSLQVQLTPGSEQQQQGPSSQNPISSLMGQVSNLNPFSNSQRQ